MQQQPIIWQNSDHIKICNYCQDKFDVLFRRKHHCRGCGKVYCDECANIYVPIEPFHPSPVRICKTCWKIRFTQKQIETRPAVRSQYNNNNNNNIMTNNNNNNNNDDWKVKEISRIFPSIEIDVIKEVFTQFKYDLSATILYFMNGTIVASTPHENKDNNNNNNIYSIVRLTTPQLEEFYQNGFLHLKNVVSRDLVENALKIINCHLGKGINKLDYHRNPQNIFDDVVFCPEAQRSKSITNLFNLSATKLLVESLLGEVHPVVNGQIALRFPQDQQQQHHHPSIWFNQHGIRQSKAWHIDGITTKNRRVQQIHNFSLLVGVYLSDALNDWQGNLTVFPGSHFLMQDYVREYGSEHLINDGVPDLNLPPPVQCKVQAGDVVFAQYHMPHTIAPNLSPDIRYAVYFRVRPAKEKRPWSEFRPEQMYNMWMDYSKMWEIVKTLEGEQPYML